MYTVWLQSPSGQEHKVRSFDLPEPAFSFGAGVLREMGAPTLASRNPLAEEPRGLVIYDPTFTVPFRVRVQGTRLVNSEGEAADSPTSIIAQRPELNE